MIVGPAEIVKEEKHQLWKVSLTMQCFPFYTRWYSSHLYTKREALERFTRQIREGTVFSIWEVHDSLDYLETCLIFLEAEEN